MSLPIIGFSRDADSDTLDTTLFHGWKDGVAVELRLNSGVSTLVHALRISGGDLICEQISPSRVFAVPLTEVEEIAIL